MQGVQDHLEPTRQGGELHEEWRRKAAVGLRGLHLAKPLKIPAGPREGMEGLHNDKVRLRGRAESGDPQENEARQPQ